MIISLDDCLLAYPLAKQIEQKQAEAEKVSVATESPTDFDIDTHLEETSVALALAYVIANNDTTGQNFEKLKENIALRRTDNEHAPTT